MKQLASMQHQSSSRYPDFVCIGAVKAGTTWLYRMLAQHPDVWLPPMKEIHYFNRLPNGETRPGTHRPTRLDRERFDAALKAIEATLNRKIGAWEKIERIHAISLIGASELTDEWYGRIFGMAPKDSLCGEVTPNYALLSDDLIRHMLSLQPDVRIIYILRDPIDRVWSHLRMREKRYGGDVEQHLKDVSEREDMVVLSDYVPTITRFRQYVAPERFLTLYFDSIVDHPLRLLHETCNFLGLDQTKTEFSGAESAVHAGEMRAIPPVLYDALRERLEPVYRRLLSLGNPVTSRWYEQHYGSS